MSYGAPLQLHAGSLIRSKEQIHEKDEDLVPAPVWKCLKHKIHRTIWFYSSYRLFFGGGAKFLILIKRRKYTQHRHSWQATCFNIEYLHVKVVPFLKMISLKAIWTVWSVTQSMPMRKTLKHQTTDSSYGWQGRTVCDWLETGPTMHWQAVSTFTWPEEKK